MKKLTEEQGIELTNRICNLLCEKQIVTSVRIAVDELINQCTEKEFPLLEIADIGGDFITVFDETHGDAKITVMANGGTVFLSVEAFRQFTQGCQKIVAWLQEQE